MADRIIELESCTLIIEDGADPAELFLSAHRILRGLVPLPKARPTQNANCASRKVKPLETVKLVENS